MEEHIALARLSPGEKAHIAALPAGRRDMARLLAFGILPGTAVEVLQTFPVYVLAVGHTILAIDKEIAASIKVSRNNP